MSKANGQKFDEGVALADQQRYCPCCGRPNPIYHSPEWLVTKFTGILAAVITRLIEARREKTTVSMTDLCRAVYEGPVTKMPVGAANTVSVMIATNRKKLQEFGWDIVGPRVTGAGYMLVPLEAR